MPKRLVQMLILAASLYGTGAAVVLLSPGAAPQRAATASAPAAADELPVTLLPTVVVHAAAPIPTLPTVVVRPDATALTQATDATDPSLHDLEADLERLTATGSAGGAFDMPYYSFGRTHHRASKE